MPAREAHLPTRPSDARRATVLWTRVGVAWSSEAEALLAAGLPAETVERAARYRDPVRRRAILAGRGLLKSALEIAGRADALDEIVRETQGRPVLPRGGGFSIAYGPDRTACAWTDEGRIGLDIEAVQQLDIADYAAVLSDSERRDLLQAADPGRAFLTLWTHKEAVAKAAGSGLTSGALPAIVGTGPVRFADATWHVVSGEIDGYAWAVASDHAPVRDIAWIELELGPDGRFVRPAGRWESGRPPQIQFNGDPVGELAAAAGAGANPDNPE